MTTKPELQGLHNIVQASVVNPWDFKLALEDALAEGPDAAVRTMAAYVAVYRRLEHNVPDRSPEG